MANGDVTIRHLASVLRSAVRIARAREPHLRTMCGPYWIRNLEELSLELLFQKLRFLLLHCGVDTINYMHRVGVFYNIRVLEVAIEILTRRNEENDPLAKPLIHRLCKYSN